MDDLPILVGHAKMIFILDETVAAAEEACETWPNASKAGPHVHLTKGEPGIK